MAGRSKFNPLVKKGFDKVDIAEAEDGIFVPVAGTVNGNLSSPIEIDSIEVHTTGTHIIVTTTEPHNIIFGGVANAMSVVLEDSSRSELEGRYYSINEITGGSPVAIDANKIMMTVASTTVGAFTATVRYCTYDMQKDGNPLVISGGVGSLTGTNDNVVIGDTISIDRWLTNGLNGGDGLTQITGTVLTATPTAVTFSTTAPNASIGSSQALHITRVLPEHLVSGIVRAEVHPDTLPDYDDYSFVTKKIVDEGRAFTKEDGSYNTNAIDTTDPHIRQTGTLIGGTSVLTTVHRIYPATTAPSAIRHNIDTMTAHGLSVAETFEITGYGVANLDGTWTVDIVHDSDTVEATKTTVPLTTSTSFYYYGSAYSYPNVEQTVAPQEVTGDIRFNNGVGVVVEKDDGSFARLEINNDNSLRITDV